MGHSQSYDLKNPEFYEIETSENGTVRGVRRISKEHHTDTVYDHFDLREEELRERIRREELRRQGAELESLRIRAESQHDGNIIDAYRSESSPVEREFNHYDELKHHSPVNPQILEKLYRLVDINNGQVLKFEPISERMYDTVPIDDSGYHRIRNVEPLNTEVHYHKTERVSTSEFDPRTLEALSKAEEVGKSTLPRHKHPEYKPRSLPEYVVQREEKSTQPRQIILEDQYHSAGSLEAIEKADEVGKSTLPRHKHPEYKPRSMGSLEAIEKADEVGKSTLPRHKHPEYKPRSMGSLELTEKSSEVGKSILPRHNHPEYQPRSKESIIPPSERYHPAGSLERSAEVGKSTLPRHNHPEYKPRSMGSLELTEKSSEVGKSTLPRHKHPEYIPRKENASELIERASEVGKSTLPRHNHPEYKPRSMGSLGRSSEPTAPRHNPPKYQDSRHLEITNPPQKFSSIEHFFAPHPTPRYVPPMTNISEIHAEKRLVVGVPSQCGIEYCTHVEVNDDDELENVVDLAREDEIGYYYSSNKISEEKLFYQPYLPTLSLDRRPVVGYYDKLP